jgi:FHA domain-containing protein
VVRGEPAEAAVPVTPRLDIGTPAASDAALWRAFCEGAGLDLQLPNGLDEQAMRTIGQVLQAAVAGTLQLIAVRASTKLELRADVTMIQPRANNPLKFAPDAQTGLEQLLVPPPRGFMAGPAAMRDAMNDLVGHSIGTMAGMRAALDGILARFEPNELESKLSGKSLLDSVLPMNRKARLWDLYRQHFDAIREEAQEDFHTLFGKAFLAAYEQQVDRLKAPRDPR